jgi:hypothetical protein
MRKILFPFLLTLLFAGCSVVDAGNSKNIALVEKYIRAVEQMDYEGMAALLSDDYIGYGPSYGDSIDKEQALEHWKYNIENLYDSIRYNRSRNVAVTIPDGVNRGEWVSNWGEVHIVYKHGRGAVTLWANSTYLIRDGQIVKSYTFYNEADALRQLGYLFCRPEDLCNE